MKKSRKTVDSLLEYSFQEKKREVKKYVTTVWIKEPTAFNERETKSERKYFSGIQAGCNYSHFRSRTPDRRQESLSRPHL